MFALIPILFETDNDIMLSPPGLKLVHTFLETCARAGKITHKQVVTNRKIIADLAAAHYFPTHFCQPQEQFTKKHTLPPALWSINAWRRFCPPHDSIMLLNFRNPLLRASMIDEAIVLYQASAAKILISGLPSGDHPCQLFTFGRTVKKQQLYRHESDSYHEYEPFPCVNGLWKRLSPGNKLINTKTGEEILGRQNYPETFEPDGALLIAHKDMMANHNDLGRSTQVYGYKSPKPGSINICNCIDLLHYQAILQAQPPETNKISLKAP